MAETSCLRPQQRTNSRRDWAIVALITGVAAVLRFHALSSKSFWFDEGVSVAIARLGWYDFARILWRREANMSLYYLLLRPWLHLGSSEAFIRSLSVLFALATIPAVYLLGRKLFDSRVGLIAALLLAVNAYHVRYSQEARSYALMTFLCVLSSLYFVKTLEDPSRRNRALYLVSSVLAVYAQFFAGLLILAQWLSLRFLKKDEAPASFRRDWRWFVLAILLIAVFVGTTGAGPLRWVPRPSGRLLWDFAVSICGEGGPLLVVAYMLACLVSLAPQFRNTTELRAPRQRWSYRFLLLWLFLPLAITLAVSLAKPLFVARYFTFCLPALVILAAAGLAQLRSRRVSAIVLLGMIALSTRGTLAYYMRPFDLGREDWRSASRYLLTNARPGDAVLFQVAMGRMPYEYYHSLLVLAPSGPAPVVLYPHHGDQITFLDFVEKPDLHQLAKSLPQYPRVWLVLSYAETPTGLDPNSQSLESLIAASHPAREEQDFPGLQVLLFKQAE